MGVVVPLAWIASSLLSLYMLVLLVRVVLDWVQLFARDWRPRGAVLVIANGVYGLTDPPLRRLGRLIPPVRLGGVGLDMGFIVLLVGIMVLQTLLGYLMRLA